MTTQDTQISEDIKLVASEVYAGLNANCYSADWDDSEKESDVEAIAVAILAERQRDQWQPIETAPKDGTIVNVVGRYLDATAGFPRYAGFRDEQWLENSRFEPQPLVCWAWRPRGEWPREGRI